MGVIINILTRPWIYIPAWILIGIGTNTAPPHYPTINAPFNGGMIAHSFAQYVISIIFWPLALWGPTFTVGKWMPL